MRLSANAGTFRKSGSSATDITTVGVTLNNTGTVDVQTGILNLTNGGTHSGNFTGTAGTIGFGGGTHLINAVSSITTQNVQFSGSGTTTINGTYNVAGTTGISNGTATINGTLPSLGSALNISGGVLNINGSNASVATLTQSNGALAGTGTVTVTGNAAITFGDHRGTGTTILQGPSTISSSGFRLDGGRTLRNEDTLTWSGGTLLFNNTFNGQSGGPGSGTLDNITGATFIASGNGAGSITASNFGGTDTGADALISNAGTFRKSGSTATDITTVAVTFNNAGTVDVQTGILNLTNGGTHSGNFTGTAGTIGFGGGTHLLNAVSSITTQNVQFSGSGTTTINGTYNVAGTTGISNGTATINGTLPSLGSALNISGGVLNINGSNASVATLTQSNGALAGTGTVTVTGNAAITFGDHRGTGTTILQGPSTISSSGFRLDGGRILRNENTLTWSGGQLLFNNTFNGQSGGTGSGTLDNIAGATFVASGDAAATIAASNFGGTDTGADALISNAGTFRKSGSSATDITTVDVTFNNTGTVDVQTGILSFTDYTQTAGETRLNGGILRSANNIDVTGGIISGQGIIDIDISGVDTLNLDNATITPGVGNDDYETLTVEGNLQGSGDSSIDIEIGSLTSFDILDITNAANFIAGDRIDILRAAGYTPNVGDSFTILTFGSAPVDLASRLQFTNLAISPTLSFQPIFNTNDITLQVVQTAAPAGITVSPTSGLVTTEWGSTAQFSVVLNTQPTGDVTIGISSSDTSEGTASTSSLTFTAANWNVAQTVTVTGVDDALVDGDVAYSIVTAAAVSGDTNYSGLDVDDVSLINTDNDADIEYGDCVAASIDFLGEKDAYLFDGSAGDRIFARMSEADGTPIDFLPELTLYAPDGTEVASDFGSSNAFLEAVELNQSGTYTLVANDQGGDATGDYTICLQSLLNPGNPVELDYGDSVTASIDPGCPCEFDVYTFTGSAGDRIFARMSEADGTPIDFLPELTLYAPDGTEVASDFGSSNAFLEAVELNQSGTYTLVANDQGGDATGDYTICLQSLLNPGNLVELDYGGSETASIDPACEFDVYTFTGSAGDRIFARMSEADVTPIDFLPELTLYAPDGTEVASDFGSSNAFLEAVELNQSGTYTLVANDQGGDATGDYTICLQSLLNPGNLVELDYGGSETASIDPACEFDVYTFTGSAGDRIFARMSEADGTPIDFLPELTLYAPDGTEVASDFGSSNAFLEAVELNQSGTYTLVANDQGGDATGDYTICLQSLLNPGNLVELDYGGSETASIDPACEFDVYTFTGSAGDRIFARMSEADGTPIDFLPELTLYAPDGTEVASDFGSSNAFLEAVELNQSGTYTLVANDQGGDATGDYTICLQSLLNPGNLVELDYGGSETASIDPACEFDVYTFTGSAGDRIFARMSEADGTPIDFLPELTLYAPDGTEVASDFGSSNAFLEAVELNQSGTYTLVANDQGGDATGDYTISLNALGITVNPTSGLVTTENGGTAQFTVVLNSQPTADVTIGISSSDTTEGTPSTSSLTFTAANWDVAQTVTVTGVDDALVDGDVAYSIVTAAAVSDDSDYSGLDADDVSLINTDNDAAGITVNPTSGLVTTENGGTAQFSVVLNSQPTADVTIGISSSDTTEGTPSTSSLTFTAANWDVAQTVTVTGVDDAVVDGDVAYSIVTAAAVSGDSDYSGLDADDVSLTNTDNDAAGITVNPTSGLVTTENGGTAQFSVVLNSQPTADVTIGISSSDTTEGTPSTSSLTFTAANWDVAQTVTVTGVDDAVVDGDVAYSIVTAAAVSGDSDYSGLDADDVSLTNTDNDAAGITVNPTSGLVTTENGGTAQFSVVLNSQPTADVTIGISSSDTTEGTPSTVVAHLHSRQLGCGPDGDGHRCG